MSMVDHSFPIGNNHENFLHSMPNSQRQVQPSYNDHSYQVQEISPGKIASSSFAIPHREYIIDPPFPPVHRSQPMASFQLPKPSDYPDIPTSPPSHYSSRQNPPIQAQVSNNRAQELGYSTSTRTASTTTPEVDNMGESAAGGGIAGIAIGVASTNERESGVEALRSLEGLHHSSQGLPAERVYNTIGSDTPYVPDTPLAFQGTYPRDPQTPLAPSATNPFDDENRQLSANPSPGQLTPGGYPSHTSIPMHEYPSQDDISGNHSSYSDNPYNRFSTAWDPRISPGEINPSEIEDDGDDEIMRPVPRRRSILGLKAQPEPTGTVAGGATGSVAGAGVLGAFGGFVGRKNVVSNGARDPSGQYGPVPVSGFDDGGAEKSDWLQRQTMGRSKMRWIVGTVIMLFVVAAIVGGVIGGIRSAKKNSSDSPKSSHGPSASDDDGHGDLGKDSAEIKALMGNPNLHKVFPGIAYTPFNAQYPECLITPPSQNNVTRDMAVLSQLTSAVRPYGTDCNQTEMVLHAIDRLGLTSMKVWLSIWVDRNETTNKRGMDAMYDILAKNAPTKFAGVIIGNEVLFRKDKTETQLAKILSDVKNNLTAQKIDLPVATSDLGDNWKAPLASEVDIVMSNIHPFFAGVESDVAAAWTWNFWDQHDIILTQGTQKRHIISEVGWPSAGGRNCGGVNCTDAIKLSSVAGIKEMNKFMGDWVCQSLTNKTEYFW